MTEHMYIKVSNEEREELHARFMDVLEDGAYLCEVPNSIPSYPYKPHRQPSQYLDREYDGYSHLPLLLSNESTDSLVF